MAILPNALGASNFARSPNVNAEQSINWPLGVGQGEPKARWWQRPFPGLRVSSQGTYGYYLEAGPIRGQFAQDGRAWAVGGNALYELFANRTSRVNATKLRLDGRPVSFASSGSAGHQLAITSGGHVYILDLLTNVLTDAAVDFYATMVDFINGYFVAPVGQTNTFRWSDLRAGLTWPSLSEAQLEQSSDFIRSLRVVHDQIWLLGSQTGVVWVNSGTIDIFAPVPGSAFQMGTSGQFANAVADDSITFVSANENGQGLVFQGTGTGSIKVVSTYAVAYDLNRAPRLDDITVWSFQIEQHPYVVVNIPTLDLSWLYDVALPPEKAWTQIGHWDSTFERYRPFRGVNHAFAFGRHLIGDSRSDAVYELSLDFPTDWLGGL